MYLCVGWELVDSYVILLEEAGDQNEVFSVKRKCNLLSNTIVSHTRFLFFYSPILETTSRLFN